MNVTDLDPTWRLHWRTSESGDLLDLALHRRRPAPVLQGVQEPLWVLDHEEGPFAHLAIIDPRTHELVHCPF